MTIHEVFPYLIVRDAPAAIRFYQRAFGATEKFRLTEPSGRVGHAELDFGGTVLMFADEVPEYGIVGPATLGGTTFAIHLHVDDADEALRVAVEAGAVLVRPAQDEFYGERSGRVRDPYGHEWLLGHNFEDVSPEERQRRYTALCTEGT